MAFNNVFQDSYQAYKVVIKFSELEDSEGVSLGLEDYVATIRPDVSVTDKLISNIHFNWQRGNDDVDAFGMAESSTASVEIIDRAGTLNPNNADSEYFGYMLAGIAVDVYISSGVDENEEPGTDEYFIWQTYGKWFTVSFNAELASGSYSPVVIALEDCLNTVGQKTIEDPDNEGTAVGLVDMGASDILTAIFGLAGLTVQDLQITIPANTFKFSALYGEYVRDAVNRVCNTLNLRCYTRLDGKVYVEPNTGVSDANHHSWTVDGMTAMTSEITTFAMYNEVTLSYANKSAEVRALGYATVDLEQGLNTVVIYFGDRAYDVRSIRAFVSVGAGDGSFDGNGSFTISRWDAWQNGVQLIVNATADIPGVTFVAFGGTELSEESKKQRKAVIGNIKTAASMRYEISYDGLLSDEQSVQLVNNAVNAIKMQSVIKRIHNTYYSLFMQAGDALTIQNCGSSFDGTYIINKVDVTAGEAYSLSVELLQAVVSE